MTKDSPTSKCGRRIESSPSISIYIILGVPRTLAACIADVSATVPTVRVLKYQRFTGLDDWRGFKMMSRRRTVHHICQCGTPLDYGCTSFNRLGLARS
uniref:Uncharacterized protein n=1 Tax=Hyaloperonospora arabidopsidis (strain Emoy2) TaxID=559515 RepID=M4BUM4_HYAAE